MEIILSHNNLDCDGLAALVAMMRLRPAARPILMGSLNRNVKDILSQHTTDLALGRPRDLRRRTIRRLILVDTQTIPPDETLQAHLAKDQPEIEIYDHHPLSDERPPAARVVRAETGATTTILVEEMQARALSISPADATLFLLGIYEDTGHLTYASTTPRDMRAAAWLLENGANLSRMMLFLDRPLSDRQTALYQALQANVAIHQISGYAVLLATARSSDYVEEVSTLAHKLTDAYDPDASFILVQIQDVVQVIARSRNEAIDVAAILKPLGGGGHAPAAAALVRNCDLDSVLADLWDSLRQGLAPSIIAADIMTRAPRIVAAGTTIARAHDLLLRYGHEALPILADGRLIGLITRRDADKAMHHGLGERPVESFATFDMPTVTPSTSLAEIQEKMRESNSGQIPVLDGDRLVGIVTRTDVIRRWRGTTAAVNLAPHLQRTIAPDVLHLLTVAGTAAEEMGYNLYLVGGPVRDLLLGLPTFDLDLVVEGDAIALAQRLAECYGGRTTSHTRFGTAKWHVPADKAGAAASSPLSLDFVTARTEFYEYPAALPQVEAGSLRQDLYRRDFTINTMAICLNGARYGELVDYYGGKADLDRRLVRVLHSLSFVDDATRILRAARLAERLHFTIEPRTAALIADARDSLDRVSGDRLRHELNLIFREAQPEGIIKRLDDMGVLTHLHPRLLYTPWLAERCAALRAALPTWQKWGWGSGSDRLASLITTYLALLAYHLSAVEQMQLMTRLNVGVEGRRILQQVAELREGIGELSGDLRPSRIYGLLRPYSLTALFVMYIAADAPTVRQAIASYVARLRHVHTEVDGSDLQALGVPPGPIYGQVLAALLRARLDGTVRNRAEEQELLQTLLTEGIRPAVEPAQ